MTALTTAAPRVTSRVSETNFYFYMALTCAAVAFIGFAPTYWITSHHGVEEPADMVVVPNELALDRRQNPAIFVNFVQD